MIFRYILILAVLFPKPTQQLYGVDVSQPTNVFSCLKQEGKVFGITRGYQKFRAVDPNAIQNLKNIRAAGMIADVYFFPCPSIDAAKQVKEFVEYFDQDHSLEELSTEGLNYSIEEKSKDLRAGVIDELKIENEIRFLQQELTIKSWYVPIEVQGQFYGRIWIDVEDNPALGCSWNDQSAQRNCDFVSELVKEFQKYNKSIYLVCRFCNNFTELPVWYAHYDNNPSFSDWPQFSFGGWIKPALKQYLGDTKLCGVNIDFNFNKYSKEQIDKKSIFSISIKNQILSYSSPPQFLDLI